MESQWEMERVRLYQLWREHPDWSQPKLADALSRSLSWVKKWLKRFRETPIHSAAMFKGRSRAPHRRARQVVAAVRDVILSLRDELPKRYGRVVGPKTILYHLHQDKLLKARGFYIPKAATTIWRVLKDAGRIPTRVKEHHPIERPEPMQHWELDFGQLGSDIEFMSVMDRGTSIMVHVDAWSHYNAETALLAVARLLLLQGCPAKLRLDNDPRFVGSWMADKYPSPLMRFLWVVGVEPDLTPPGKPQEKPVVERSIRTEKHECLWQAAPANWQEALDFLILFMHFYNHERANQSLACGNRPPYEAFPNLPRLPYPAQEVDPDAWLTPYHQHVFERRIGRGGSIFVGNHRYYIDYRLAKETVRVQLDAKQRVFHILHAGRIVCQKEIQGLVGHSMPFQAYLKQMAEEARTLPTS